MVCYTINVFLPEQDLSFFFFILPEMLVRWVTMMFLIIILIFFCFFLLTTIVTQSKLTVMFTHIYISVVALCITSNSSNNHKSIILPRHNTNLHTHNQHETFLNDAYRYTDIKCREITTRISCCTVHISKL